MPACAGSPIDVAVEVDAVKQARRAVGRFNNGHASVVADDGRGERQLPGLVLGRSSAGGADNQQSTARMAIDRVRTATRRNMC